MKGKQWIDDDDDDDDDEEEEQLGSYSNQNNKMCLGCINAVLAYTLKNSHGTQKWLDRGLEDDFPFQLGDF